jgi:hypothetical protein
MPAIETITDALLIDAIEGASGRVVMIAPGVWPPLAHAITRAWQRLGNGRMTVILDIDPEIYRLGYGSLEGLQILQKAATAAGEALSEEPGIRICVLIVDEKTFVFSPTPCLVEEPPGSEQVQGTTHPRPNGIVLSKPPEMLESDLGNGTDGNSNHTLGAETMKPEKLEAIVQNLTTNPPKSFNLARAVNVYNAKIQFVEFKVEGCRLSQHKARLPKHLLHVINGNDALSKKIENSIQLLDSEDALVTDPKLSQETIFKRRDSIAEKYLRSVKGIGTVIERERKPAFSKEVEDLKSEVVKFSKQVEGVLFDRFRETAEQLTGVLLQDVLADIPQKWRRSLGNSPNPDRVRWKIMDDLLAAFGDPGTKVGKMKVDTIFKDVTYDMLKDPDFRTTINELFPDLPLMVEGSAVEERASDSSNQTNSPS